MPPKPTFSGNWRDYFTIADTFGPDKPLLEKALDDIAATGKDGQDLLMKAYESAIATKTITAKRSAALEKETGIKTSPFDTKVEFRSDGGIARMLGHDLGSHVDAFSPGIINIDPKQVRQLGWKDTKGTFHHASLTGIMVHELFHQADPNFRLDVRQSPEKQKEFLDKIVPSKTLSFDQKKAAMTGFMELTNEFMGKYITKGAPPEQIAKQSSAAMEAFDAHLLQHSDEVLRNIEKKKNLPKGSFTLPALKDPQYSLKMIMDWKAKIEGDATHYTDAFMAKHFPKEPWRGVYENAILAGALDKPIVQEQGCGTVISGGYNAETISVSTLGKLTQPVIGKEKSPFCGQPARK